MTTASALVDRGSRTLSPAFVSALLVIAAVVLGLVGLFAWRLGDPAPGWPALAVGPWFLAVASLVNAALRWSRPALARGAVNGALAGTATYLLLGPWHCATDYDSRWYVPPMVWCSPGPSGPPGLDILGVIGRATIGAFVVGIAVALAAAIAARPAGERPGSVVGAAPSAPLALAGLIIGLSGFQPGLLFGGGWVTPVRVTAWPLVLCGAAVVVAAAFARHAWILRTWLVANAGITRGSWS